MIKSLEKRKKVLLLHPQQRKTLLEIPIAGKNRKERNFQKKIRKSLRELKKLFTFAPRKTRKVHWKIGRKTEKGSEKKSFKIFRVLLAGNKKNF